MLHFRHSRHKQLRSAISSSYGSKLDGCHVQLGMAFASRDVGGLRPNQQAALWQHTLGPSGASDARAEANVSLLTATRTGLTNSRWTPFSPGSHKTTWPAQQLGQPPARWQGTRGRQTKEWATIYEKRPGKKKCIQNRGPERVSKMLRANYSRWGSKACCACVCGMKIVM